MLILMFILIGVFFLILYVSSSSLGSFLGKSHKEKANLLIVEAWLPVTAIDLIKNEIINNSYDFVITTGIQSEELDFCMVPMNGYLIFYPKTVSINEVESRQHKIGVIARSEMGGIYSSHFNVFINDSLVADFNADEETRNFEVEWFGKPNEFDSLMVQFTNDYFDDSGDRNLYIKEIIIDNEMVIPYQFNSVYDVGSLGGNNRIINDFRSHSELMRNNLINYGIDPQKIIAVTGKRTKVNRTLNGALAFRRWLKTSDSDVAGINIVTLGIHARRTWLTYRKVLNNVCPVGVIPIPVTHDIKGNTSDRLAVIAETIALIYYWIILNLY